MTVFAFACSINLLKELREDSKVLDPIAMIMLKALNVAYPDAATIEPKDATDEIALNQLRDAEYVDLYDMWPNGDRRWTITRLGRERLARSPQESVGS